MLMAPFTGRLRRKVVNSGMHAPDQVFGLRWSGQMTKARLLHLIPRLPEGLNEIYLHPATRTFYWPREGLSATKANWQPSLIPMSSRRAANASLNHGRICGFLALRSAAVSRRRAQRGLVVFRAPKFRLAVIALVGGALAFYILKSIGLKPIFLAATAVGWRGFTILCVYQLGLFVVLGTAWHVLLPASCRSRAPVFMWARMVRDATSDLLPFSHLGGIVLGARTAMSHRVPQPVAIGSIVTDVTTEMLAQIAFTAVGVVILTTSTPHNSPTIFHCKYRCLRFGDHCSELRGIRRFSTLRSGIDDQTDFTPVSERGAGHRRRSQIALRKYIVDPLTWACPSCFIAAAGWPVRSAPGLRFLSWGCTPMSGRSSRLKVLSAQCAAWPFWCQTASAFRKSPTRPSRPYLALERKSGLRYPYSSARVILPLACRFCFSGSGRKAVRCSDSLQVHRPNPALRGRAAKTEEPAKIKWGVSPLRRNLRPRSLSLARNPPDDCKE